MIMPLQSYTIIHTVIYYADYLVSMALFDLPFFELKVLRGVARGGSKGYPLFRVKFFKS